MSAGCTVPTVACELMNRSARASPCTFRPSSKVARAARCRCPSHRRGFEAGRAANCRRLSAAAASHSALARGRPVPGLAATPRERGRFRGRATPPRCAWRARDWGLSHGRGGSPKGRSAAPGSAPAWDSGYRPLIFFHATPPGAARGEQARTQRQTFEHLVCTAHSPSPCLMGRSVPSQQTTRKHLGRPCNTIHRAARAS